MDGIKVRARIRLLAASEGGRDAPVGGSYRPNHNFGEANNRQMDIAFLEFADGEFLHSGQTAELELTFWNRPGLRDVLVPAAEWRIQEGARLVGIGVVLQVL